MDGYYSTYKRVDLSKDMKKKGISLVEILGIVYRRNIYSKGLKIV